MFSFDALIAQFQIAKEINIKTCLVLKGGKEIGAFCNAPYSFDEMQMLFSMTKSLSSLAIGIACDHGYLNLEDRVIDILSDKLPERLSENLKSMRILDLLVMASGVQNDAYSDIYPQQDWVKAFLQQEFEHQPGTHYRYNTHGSHMLSAIIDKVTGRNLLDFLDDYLFQPLGIVKPQWEAAPDGHIAGGMGLSLLTRDIAKIGQMILDDGRYQGKQIISKAYLQEATKAQIIKPKDNRYPSDIKGLEYGYQFHIDKFGNARMDGAFGQLCLVLKNESMVIVVTSTNSKMESLLKAIYESFSAEPLEDMYLIANHDRDAIGNLSNLRNLGTEGDLCELGYFNDPTELAHTAKFTPTISNFEFHGHDVHFKYLKIEINVRYIKLTTFKDKGAEGLIVVDRDKSFRGTSNFIKDLSEHKQKYISSVISESQKSIRFRIWYIETPYIVDYTLVENENDVTLSFDMNVSFAPVKHFIVHTEYATQKWIK